MELIDVQMIWDQAPHNAFTDLIRFKNHWICVFREGHNHMSPDGSLRVLTSLDGKKWMSGSLITSPSSDLRDGKLCITPEGQLMLSGGELVYDGEKYTTQSLAWFSDDGCLWSERVKIGDTGFWLWGVTWHAGIAYTVGYCNGSVRLYSSRDGTKFSVLLERLFDVGMPNESSLTFENNTAYCLLRREQANGLLGISLSPYTQWEWKDLGVRIGGPRLLCLPDGRLVAGVRLYDNEVRTSLCLIDPQTGSFTESLKLPSGGDTSYPGLIWYQDILWLSYYSSHEGKTAIYLAKIKV